MSKKKFFLFACFITITSISFANGLLNSTLSPDKTQSIQPLKLKAHKKTPFSTNNGSFSTLSGDILISYTWTAYLSYNAMGYNYNITDVTIGSSSPGSSTPIRVGTTTIGYINKSYTQGFSYDVIYPDFSQAYLVWNGTVTTTTTNSFGSITNTETTPTNYSTTIGPFPQILP